MNEIGISLCIVIGSFVLIGVGLLILELKRNKREREYYAGMGTTVKIVETVKTKTVVEKSFLTGSRAYGTPRLDSDIDLVVLVSKEDLDKLKERQFFLTTEQKEAWDKFTKGYESLGGTPLRFAMLNLICCTDEKSFAIWKKGTKMLVDTAPATRRQAIDLFQALRDTEGDKKEFAY